MLYTYLFILYTHTYVVSFPSSQQVQVTVDITLMCILFYQSKNIIMATPHASINKDKKAGG